MSSFSKSTSARSASMCHSWHSLFHAFGPVIIPGDSRQRSSSSLESELPRHSFFTLTFRVAAMMIHLPMAPSAATQLLLRFLRCGHLHLVRGEPPADG